MKPTFKQFLEDIDVDDDVYNPIDAENTVQVHQRSLLQKEKEWKPLPAKFPEPGFEILWRKGSYRENHVALVDKRRISKSDLPFGFAHLSSTDPRIAVHLILEERTVDLPTGEIAGMTTGVLSGNKIYRGSGIASMLYETLVRSGQVLFSSDMQTTGGKSNWMKLTNRLNGEFDIGVVMKSGDASWYVMKHAGLNHKLIDRLRQEANDEMKNARADELIEEKHDSEWLAVGDLEAVQALAYADSNSTLIIAPKGTFDKHLKYAIRA